MLAKQKIEEAPEEVLKDPVRLFIWKKFGDEFDPEKLKNDGWGEIERRIDEKERKHRSEVEKAESDRKKLVEAVFKEIFEHFTPVNTSWNETVKCYDSGSHREYTLTVADLFKQNFRSSWNFDPRKNREGLLNEVMLDLKEPVHCIYPVHDPHTTLRHKLESLSILVRRNR